MIATSSTSWPAAIEMVAFLVVMAFLFWLILRD
jgi:hypothetical protein